MYKNGTLEFFSHTEGIVEHEADGYKYVYQFKDHLGNIRLSYKDAGNNGSITQSEIVQEKNYYPFGLQHQGYNTTISGRKHDYGYNGKEEQSELGLEWLDFGARNYDASLGRWMNIDPLANHLKQIDKSPYAAFWNNPIKYIDPDGKFVIDPNATRKQRRAIRRAIRTVRKLVRNKDVQKAGCIKIWTIRFKTTKS